MSKLYPWAEAASAYQIDYQKEYDNGVRGVLFDVDNTLVRHGEPATKQAKELFEHLRSIGLKTCIISNNKEPRVSPFAKEVGSDYIYKAGKPSVRGYEDAMKRIHTTPDTTIFIGDQIFTDIYGANRAGIRTYLVQPIHPKEEIQIVLKRYIERIVLFFTTGGISDEFNCLIGFMGAGKTTVGKELVKKGFELIDTDAYIEACEKMSISDIFVQKEKIIFVRQRQKHSRRCLYKISNL